MRRDFGTHSAFAPVLVFVLLVCLPWAADAQQIDKQDCLFLSSLHHTAQGMGYWYDASHGGLETVTGVP
jgi:hypothetical protein